MKQFMLDNFFCDGMIFQRNTKLKISGIAYEKCDITVIMNNNKVCQSVNAGNFVIKLPGREAGEGYSFTIYSDKQSDTISDIYIGDVYIAGGQSNMAMSLNQTKEYKDGEAVIPNDNIRFYNVGRNILERPEEYGEGYEWAYNKDCKWVGCNDASASDFSAVAYYFAQKLQKELQIPIGIIGCNVGGSNITGWMSEETIRENDDIKNVLQSYYENLKKLDTEAYTERLHEYLDGIKSTWGPYVPETASCYFEVPGPFSFKRPCGLYKTMLSKTFHFAVKGMLWYQGESEAFAEASDSYRSAMCSLIKMLKQKYENEEFTFAYVQIAPWNEPTIRDWEGICNAQREFYLQNPGYPMITIGDCGDVDIHPPVKKPVGIRLANAALSKYYNKPEEYCGPCAVSAIYDGKLIELDFIHNDGLNTDNDIGIFEVEDERGNIQTCNAFIKSNKVYVEYGKAETPKFIRYAWAAFPYIGLYNSSKLPASIFRLNIEKAGSCETRFVIT